jgi:hypothetical protein
MVGPLVNITHPPGSQVNCYDTVASLINIHIEQHVEFVLSAFHKNTLIRILANSGELAPTPRFVRPCTPGVRLGDNGP